MAVSRRIDGFGPPVPLPRRAARGRAARRSAGRERSARRRPRSPPWPSAARASPGGWSDRSPPAAPAAFSSPGASAWKSSSTRPARRARNSFPAGPTSEMAILPGSGSKNSTAFPFGRYTRAIRLKSASAFRFIATLAASSGASGGDTAAAGSSALAPSGAAKQPPAPTTLPPTRASHAMCLLFIGSPLVSTLKTAPVAEGRKSRRALASSPCRAAARTDHGLHLLPPRPAGEARTVER